MNKIEWFAPEHIHTEKNTDWYWIVGIITVTISLISIILNNVIFAILILVSGFTLSLFASKRPETVKVEVNESGILFNKTFYSYKDIDSFFVETRDNYPRIILKLKSYISPITKILINPEDADEIEKIIGEHVQKEELTESIFEKVLIYFGF